MSGVGFAVLFFGGLFGVSWVYSTIKKKAKRNIFFRDQYARQRQLIDRNVILMTTASIDSVVASLAHFIPNDTSVKAAFLGGGMRVHMESPNRIIFKHASKIGTGGSGDEFSASVTFNQVSRATVRAEVSIDRWREKDGVTRRAGIQSMENFINTVTAAFRAVDPAVRIGA
ncbi:hypothetical protein [Mycobacterium sp. OTB74]|uniref:hypothetical protein n=1 Tax=Mycobacterium sp. OTB74 TaxID=1853452 RepID=UPI0024734595|nr:hypothetical protein [Mycobacterium sp. OTB74]MDH6244902.1 hypothetical protein [Mycobacterium sp. OTB74]